MRKENKAQANIKYYLYKKGKFHKAKNHYEPKHLKEQKNVNDN